MLVQTSTTAEPRISGQFIPLQLVRYEDVSSYRSKTLSYPERAVESGIEGRVILYMSLSKGGSLPNIAVLKSADTSLDGEAFRVARSMNEWKPAAIDRIPISLCVTFPITFRQY